MPLSTTFLCKLDPSSSSPLVAGVFAVEPVLLLEKGTEETLGEVDVVEAPKRSAAAFLVYLAMAPTITAQLMLARQETDSGLFAKPMGRGEKKKRMMKLG